MGRGEDVIARLRIGGKNALYTLDIKVPLMSLSDSLLCVSQFSKSFFLFL